MGQTKKVIHQSEPHVAGMMEYIGAIARNRSILCGLPISFLFTLSTNQIDV